MTNKNINKCCALNASWVKEGELYLLNQNFFFIRPNFASEILPMGRFLMFVGSEGNFYSKWLHGDKILFGFFSSENEVANIFEIAS